MSTIAAYPLICLVNLLIDFHRFGFPVWIGNAWGRLNDLCRLWVDLSQHMYEALIQRLPHNYKPDSTLLTNRSEEELLSTALQLT